jgi:hypothetical protein
MEFVRPNVKTLNATAYGDPETEKDTHSRLALEPPLLKTLVANHLVFRNLLVKDILATLHNH